MSKKVCIVDSDFAHKRIGLATYLINAGFEVTIIGSSHNSFPKGINYVHHDLKRNFSIASDYNSYKWYKHFFSIHTFDIIHTFNTKPAFLIPLALRKSKTPITRTINGLGKIFMSKSIFSILLTKVYLFLHFLIRKRPIITIFQNHDDKNFFLKNKLINNKNFEIILSSGIELKDLKLRAKRDNQEFTFICVSRLLLQKGIVNYIEAAKICIDKGHNFIFLLVGPLEEDSKNLNKNILENNGVVNWLGHRADVLDLLSKSSALVLPTFYGEGFPRVILEAAAVGLPIISTNTAGVREFGVNNKDILLIQPNDSNILAETLIKVATDKELSDKLAKNSLNQVQNYSLEKVAKQYIDTFNKILQLT